MMFYFVVGVLKIGSVTWLGNDESPLEITKPTVPSQDGVGRYSGWTLDT